MSEGLSAWGGKLVVDAHAPLSKWDGIPIVDAHAPVLLELDIHPRQPTTFKVGKKHISARMAKCWDPHRTSTTPNSP